MQTPTTVKVQIDQNGNVIIEVSGVSGPSCLSITSELEKELGTLMGRKHKSDMDAVDLSIANKAGEITL
jgi:hypothetical protein